MDDRQFRELLHRFELSWDGYRKVRKGVKKRIRRHMQQLKCQNVRDYFVALEKDKEQRRQCERLMTVSISRFFRDRGLWLMLENEVLPCIIDNNKALVKVWSAGSACGEEVYSFKILWDRLRERFESSVPGEVAINCQHPVENPTPNSQVTIPFFLSWIIWPPFANISLMQFVSVVA